MTRTKHLDNHMADTNETINNYTDLKWIEE